MKIESNKELRKLPSVEKILEAAKIQLEINRYSRALVTRAAQQTLVAIRGQISAGNSCPSFNAVVDQIKHLLVRQWPGFLSPVINATGVILHTNLGRAPLSQDALASLAEISGNFYSLEYNLSTGKRGARAVEMEKLLCLLTGAESALVVNNNAAAVLLVLVVLARNRETVVSRGELVQIGGGFRVPDIMQQSGVSLKEVGTTNQTYIKDYEEAISGDTALLMKVHRSNFTLRGFTSEVSVAQLKALAERHNLPVVYDLGSGALLNTEDFGLEHELTVQQALADGADIVCFSGDKLLGGPQAGIILGRKEYVDQLRKHPLMRVIRIDKMTAVALGATIRHYLQKEAVVEIPIWKMITAGLDEIESRAKSVTASLKAAGITAEVVDGSSTVGGGSLPDQTLPTKVVAIRPPYQLEDFTARLRLAQTPLIGRIEDDKLILDMRSVLPALDDSLVRIIKSIAKETGR
jgi:L-seryl-tRNA(Ser) seleniumtransferase